MVKKHLIALFLNTGEKGTPTWTRIKKSTELTIAMNPETEEQDYIADESPTSELVGYAPKIEQPLKMIETEPDFKYIWDKFYTMSTGETAKTEYLIVFMFEKGLQNEFKAWKGEATVICNELNAVDSEINFELAFGGTVEKGTATVEAGKPIYKAPVGEP